MYRILQSTKIFLYNHISLMFTRLTILNGMRQNASRFSSETYDRGEQNERARVRGLAIARKELSIGFRVEQEGPYRFNVSISGY